MNTQTAPDDVKLDMPDPDVPLCVDCIDAYRNGIEPGGTACVERNLYAFQTAARELSDVWLDARTVADIEGLPRTLVRLRRGDVPHRGYARRGRTRLTKRGHKWPPSGER